MSAKAIVKTFYDLDLAKDANITDVFHDNCTLHWNSSQGFNTLKKADIAKKIEEVKQAYTSFTYKISHLLEDDNTVTARYTIYATTIERPTKHEPLAHFISIWEVKDEKLYRGWEISQLIDENPQSLSSFSEIKI